MFAHKSHHLTGKASLLAGLCLSLVLPGCEWVDSVGQTEPNELPSLEVFFDDEEPFTVVTIDEADDLLITSNASDRDGVITTWRWSEFPVRQGVLSACNAMPGFDDELAVSSLQDACFEPNCAVQFNRREVEAINGEDMTVSGALDAAVISTAQFIAVMPTLKAPVGVAYALTATDNRGGRVLSEHTFCVNSVNEPPVAVDDAFTMGESDVLLLTLNDTTLLDNDKDDADIRSEPLQVNVVPVSPPLAADDFELFSDGTFRYSYAGAALANDVADVFQYEISDGVFTSSATVTINIVAQDDPPQIASAIPIIAGVVGIPLNYDLNTHVQDPEGAAVGFNALESTLPSSGNVTLSAGGILRGTPSAADVGEYDVQVTANDGKSIFEFSFALSLSANQAVEATRIPAQDGIVDERISFSVAEYFTDPEGQPLEFTISNDNAAVDLSVSTVSGLVTGVVSAAGTYLVKVSASDGTTVATTATVELVIERGNAAPAFTGIILGQNWRAGTIITPVRPEFSDPDGDTLEFTLEGDLPVGVSLSETTGVISGRPLRRGQFRGVRIIATDPDGLTAESNSFNISVR